MKKLVFPLLLCSGFLQVSAQSWADNLVTQDLPMKDLNGVFVNDLEIQPDAVTSNSGNSNSTLEENSVIAIYSPSTVLYGTSYSNHFWSNPDDLGSWLIVKEPISGNTSLSKRIKVPNGFLRVNSLQYDFGDNRELLIFTGALVDTNDTGLNQMVVGSYNFLTDDVYLEVVEQYYSTTGQFVQSQGVGVREIESDNSDHFFAIGQSSDETNEYIDDNDLDYIRTHIGWAVYPIGVVFEVSNSGSIAVKHAEIKDFMFKPHSVSDPISQTSGKGFSLVVAGMQIYYPNDCQDVCQGTSVYGSCSTSVAPAVYTFDAVNSGSNWAIEVENGMQLLTDEFAYCGLSYQGISYFDVHVFAEESTTNGPTEVFLGLTTKLEAGSSAATGLSIDGSDLMIFKLHISTSSGIYTLDQEVKYNLLAPDITGDEVFGGLDRFFPNYGEDDFQVVFALGDPQGIWGRDNQTSIGLMTLQKSDITSGVAPFKSIYSADVHPWFGSEVTRISHTTGIRISRDSWGSDQVYLLADGHTEHTAFTRAHFASSYFDALEEANFPCFDEGVAQPSSPNATEIIEDHKDTRSTPNTERAAIYIDDINYDNWDCSYYPYVEFKKAIAEINEKSNSAELIKIGKNLYQIDYELESISEFQLFDLSGKQVQIDLTNNNFSLEGLTKGVYIVKYKTLNEQHSEKLMVD